MKNSIFIIGPDDSILDEGVAIRKRQIISKLEINSFNIQNIGVSISGILKILLDRPKILITVLTPTYSGILFSKIFSYICPTIIYAAHPYKNYNNIVKYLKCQKIIVESKDAFNLFNKLNFNVEVIRFGINTTKFKQITTEEKQSIRDNYGYKKDDFILLHLGSIKKGRNVKIFSRVKKYMPNVKIIIVSRPHEQMDLDIYKELTNVGCIIINEHVDNIHEYYQLSDVYVFPTLDKKSCIDTPLSVLEAMACNISVVTTKFGSLIDLFPNEGDGFYYFQNDDELIEKILYIKYDKVIPKTRATLASYNFEKDEIRFIDIIKSIYTNK